MTSYTDPSTDASVDGDDITPASVNTDQATVGPSNRPYTSGYGTTQVNIPGDYSTVQAALLDLPRVIEDSYRITIDDGYSDATDHLYIPPFIGRFIQEGRTVESPPLEINGNATTPSQVKVGSAYVDSAQASGAVRLVGLEFQDGSPYGDENASVDASGCEEIYVKDCATVHGDGSGADGSTGISCEASRVWVNGFDLGTSLQLGFDCKHMSMIAITDEGAISGSPQNLYRNLQGVIKSYSGVSATADGATVAPDSNMPIYLNNDRILMPDSVSISSPNWIEMTVRGSAPGGVPNGTFWYDQGLNVQLGGAPRQIPWNPGREYTPSNVTDTRSFDANATTVDELADVVGTLINDLQTGHMLD